MENIIDIGQRTLELIQQKDLRPSEQAVLITELVTQAYGRGLEDGVANMYNAFQHAADAVSSEGVN